MITNQEHANFFLKFYENNNTELHKNLRSLAHSIGYASDEYKEELEDEFIVTVTKCYNKILEKGMLPKAKRGVMLTWDETYAAYFYMSLRNNLVQWAKKKKTQRKREGKYEREYLAASQDRTEAEEFDIVPTQVDESQGYEDIVMEAFATLPHKYKDVIYMYGDGLSYKQIEEVLNLSTGQVKMRLMTARKKVKEYVKTKIGIDIELPDPD